MRTALAVEARPDSDETPRRKTYHRGTHRAVAPRETVERFLPVARRIGVTRLANVTGLDVISIPVWVAVRPNSRGLSTSQGKGLTHEAAMASALMESIENWHGENIVAPVRYESACRLGRHGNVVDLEQLNRYADAVVRPDLPLPWLGARDILNDCDGWVPFEAVSTNYVVSSRGTLESTFVQSSNGLASGNDLDEAILHGLYEVIERDALAQTADAMRAVEASRLIDRSSITDPDCCAALDKLDRAGVTAALFDLTADIDVPVYGCVIVEGTEQNRWRVLPQFSGYGCHLSPGVALSRAVTEAVQSRLTFITGSRDDILWTDYRRGGRRDEVKALHDAVARTRPEADFSLRPDASGGSCAEDLAVVLGRVTERVERVLVVDLTQPDLQVPVVKVVAPGLAVAPGLLHGRRTKTPGRASRTSGAR